MGFVDRLGLMINIRTINLNKLKRLEKILEAIRNNAIKINANGSFVAKGIKGFISKENVKLAEGLNMQMKQNEMFASRLGMALFIIGLGIQRMISPMVNFLKSAVNQYNELFGVNTRLGLAMKTLAVEFQVAKTQLIAAMEPIIKKLVDLALKVVKAFKESSPSTKRFIGTILLLVAAFGALFTPISAFLFAIVALAGFLKVPILLMSGWVGVILLIIVALIYLITNWDKVKTFVLKIIKKIGGGLLNFLNIAKIIFKSFVVTAKDKFTNFVKNTISTVRKIKPFFSNIFTAIKDGVKNKLIIIAGFFVNIFNGVKDFISNVFLEIFDNIKSIFLGIINFIIGGINNIIGAIETGAKLFGQDLNLGRLNTVGSGDIGVEVNIDANVSSDIDIETLANKVGSKIREEIASFVGG